jgi:hypothetical protein
MHTVVLLPYSVLLYRTKFTCEHIPYPCLITCGMFPTCISNFCTLYVLELLFGLHTTVSYRTKFTCERGRIFQVRPRADCCTPDTLAYSNIISLCILLWSLYYLLLYRTKFMCERGWTIRSDHVRTVAHLPRCYYNPIFSFRCYNPIFLLSSTGSYEVHVRTGLLLPY